MTDKEQLENEMLSEGKAFVEGVLVHNYVPHFKGKNYFFTPEEQRLMNKFNEITGTDFNDIKSIWDKDRYFNDIWENVSEGIPGILGRAAKNFVKACLEKPNTFVLIFCEKLSYDICEKEKPRLLNALSQSIGQPIELRIELIYHCQFSRAELDRILSVLYPREWDNRIANKTESQKERDYILQTIDRIYTVVESIDGPFWIEKTPYEREDGKTVKKYCFYNGRENLRFSKREMKMFLQTAAIKCGVPKDTARWYRFVNKLFKQFFNGYR
jgi:hypothetical protein